MEFYFIRHGESENNALWTRTKSSMGRSPDPGLTAIGRQQAEILASYLAHTNEDETVPDWHNRRGFFLTHLYTSLFSRAAETAQIVADRVNLPLMAWADIHEWGGIFQIDEATGERIGLPGPNRQSLENRFPRLKLPESMDENGWWNRPFERREEAPGRAQRVWRELLRRHGSSDDRVAMVSHGGFYHTMLGVLLGYSWQNLTIGDPMIVEFEINNAAITRIDFDDDNITLRYLNRVDFLPADLIT